MRIYFWACWFWAQYLIIVIFYIIKLSSQEICPDLWLHWAAPYWPWFDLYEGYLETRTIFLDSVLFDNFYYKLSILVGPLWCSWWCSANFVLPASYNVVMIWWSCFKSYLTKKTGVSLQQFFLAILLLLRKNRNERKLQFVFNNVNLLFSLIKRKTWQNVFFKSWLHLFEWQHDSILVQSDIVNGLLDTQMWYPISFQKRVII